MAEEMFSEHAVVISDDEASVNPEAENPIGEGSALVELQSDKPAVDPDEPRLWTVLIVSRTVGNMETPSGRT
jgi:hypothetical protein